MINRIAKLNNGSVKQFVYPPYHWQESGLTLLYS